ncbi:MAG: hypothetical protein GKR89_19800 [Candidatus Latescibacteria bacterium]|nr:hypothetical protein [Candidatus Latescibacterota bacterium]
MTKPENLTAAPRPDTPLSPAQLAQFKAEGALPIPGLVPADVLAGWKAQMRAACTDGVDLDDPDTWPTGRYAPTGGWPDFSPNLYDLPGLQAIVEQLGDGAFAPSHPAGQPWTPQIPMTRVILPSAPDTEWAPPDNGHLDGYATGWGGGFMAFFAVLLWDVSSPIGGGTAYWPKSHLANHRYFLANPERFDGSYLFTEPVLSGGHQALLDGDPSVGEIVCMTGRAGDAMLFHGLTTHVGSINAPGSRQPRVAQFARYSHMEMRQQAPMVMFPDKDGKPWSPPSNTPVVPEAQAATGFLPSGHPGRQLTRYEVPQNLWKYWGPALNT